MASKGISVSNSRFACLKIEDDDEEEKKQQPKTNNLASTKSNSARKKNKKKKEQRDDTEQLKHLAFGKPVSGKQQHQRNGPGDRGDNKQSWDEWKQHDVELVEEQYKEDLAKALLASKLETEQKKQEAQLLQERIDAGLEMPATKEGKKKKKQKEKNQPMSLEQFKQLPKEKPIGSDDSDEERCALNASPPVQTRVPPTEQDPRFFNSVDDDTEQILRQEKIQEEYRKQYSKDNVIVAKLQNDLEEKDQSLIEMKKKMEEMQVELKQVKKRNKQLCVILAQGEMKDKAQVLLQVDELNAVKDELTEQVTSLTGELEKEKSKNHALKSELDKLKNGKHGK